MSGAVRKSEVKPSNRIENILDLASKRKSKLLDNKLEKLLANPYALTENHGEVKRLYLEDKNSEGRYFESNANRVLQ